ncbi:Xaa-Pro aminopeptidase [Propionibacterium ruminifibrarum]|uniref:Xaa-Pro aminopeptidase n=1 Tax=Propionibacterium ruminifibrarum TaxID=1962131 RepID=A0A375I5Y4_9ACTN|nr:aminopeptidase P family protein [Propionibacterium ruminifibrarum]SPF68655.1 Xaa-Pro aminopeptidase [Propionibacterium ruminifibrarum]
MSEQEPQQPRSGPRYSDAFKDFITSDWAPYPTEPPPRLPAAPSAAAHRAALAALFPGERLIIPAGGYRRRNNDCDFPYRPHSAFAHLSGLGTDREPDAVLVIEPDGEGVLHFHPRAPRTDPEFYSDARYGEMWVGARESLEEMSAMCGMRTADIGRLPALIEGGGAPLRVIREADRGVTELVDRARGMRAAADGELHTAADELRLVKDDWELGQLREACRVSAEAFTDVVAHMDRAVAHRRGERLLEGVFGMHARTEGNAVGYDSIVAAGDHANTLHWVHNDGPVRPGDLVLMDAGIELDSLYTADITRTMPVTGSFTDAQRQVHDTVRAAQQAGMDAARPGAGFLDVHRAAVQVLAQAFHDWGILPVSVDEALSTDGGQWRRWMVHGTSHHLGLDVHDCAHARAEQYRQGTLAEGMVITVEPGIYFKSTDLLVPEPLRGIGVRIEDDIVITADGCSILSDQLPRDSAGVEAWMGSVPRV